jgi:CheY-like chemotaxis protein
MTEPIIMIVSRDEDARIIFGAALHHAGFTVRVCDDPDRALPTALDQRPALVITSYPTVGAAGITVTELLRTDPRTAEIPIMSVTSHVLQQELRQAQEAGVDVSLPMPIPLSDLVTAVRDMLAGGNQRH